MQLVDHDDYLQIINHPRAKHFLKKLPEGVGSDIFQRRMNLPTEQADEIATKIAFAVQDYIWNIYQMEVKHLRFKKSYYHFINQKDIIAMKMNYVFNTMLHKYPEHFYALYESVLAFVSGKNENSPTLHSELHKKEEYRKPEILEKPLSEVETAMIPKSKVITIPESSTVGDFRKLFLSQGYHGYPVVNASDIVIGLISFWHIQKINAGDDTPVHDVMCDLIRRSELRVQKQTTLKSVYNMMMSKNYRRIFVYDAFSFIGLLTQSAVALLIGDNNENLQD